MNPDTVLARAKINQRSLDEYQWELVESPVNAITEKVIDMMISYAKGEKMVSEEYKTIGNVYDKIREQVLDGSSKIVYEPEITTYRNKKEAIIADNYQKRINSDLADIVANTEKCNYIYKPNTYLELKIINLMLLARKLSNPGKVYELDLELRRIVNRLEHLPPPTNISSQLIPDIQSIIDNDLNIRMICQRYPELTTISPYTKYIFGEKLQLYDTQKQLLEAIKTPDQKLIFLTSITDSGKTSSLVLLASYFKYQRNKKRKILFICHIEIVRIQVANLAYNAQIPFSIGNSSNIVNSRICESIQQEPVLTIADLGTGYDILMSDATNEYVVFIDEPTIDADMSSSPITYKVFRMIYDGHYQQMILSSATLTNIERITWLYQQKHPHVIPKEITNKDAKKGMTLRDVEGNIICPHYGAQDLLPTKINSIASDPFVGKMYTYPTYYLMKGDEKYTELSQKEVKNNVLSLLKNGSDVLQLEKQEQVSNVIEIFTTKSYLFAGGALIATKDPLDFVNRHIKAGEFKGEYVINSDKFLKKMNLSIPNFKFRRDPIDIFRQMELPALNDQLKYLIKLLYIGVGVYSESFFSKKVNRWYKNTVLQFLNNNMLAFIIADDSICYGADYGFKHVIITQDISESRSVLFLFQLMGRSGREGKATSSNILLLHSSVKTQIMDYVDGKIIPQDHKNIDTIIDRVISNPRDNIRELSYSKHVKERTAFIPI